MCLATLCTVSTCCVSVFCHVHCYQSLRITRIGGETSGMREPNITKCKRSWCDAYSVEVPTGL